MGIFDRKTLEVALSNFFVASFVLILILLPVHAFLSTWLGTTIGPLLIWKSWKEILLLFVAILAIFYFYLKPDVFRVLISRKINWLIAGYLILHIILALIMHVPRAASIAGLLMNLRFFAMFALAQVLVESGNALVDKIKKRVPVWLLWTALGLSILAILQVTVIPKDFLTHFGYTKDATIAPYIVVDQNPNALRAFATMRGPNTLGEFLILPLLLACYFIFKRKALILGWSTLILGTVTLLTTGSRSAWLGLFVSLAVLIFEMVPWQVIKRFWWAGAIIAGMGLAIVGLATVNSSLRLAIFHSRADRASLLTGSSQKHVSAIIENSLDAIKHPLGEGPGAAGPASFYNPGGAKISENYFVQIAQEVGFLGLAIFIVINILLAIDLYKNKVLMMPALLFASLIGLTVVNFFLHGWADDPTSMIWWGIAGLYFSSSRSMPAESSDMFLVKADSKSTL